MSFSYIRKSAFSSLQKLLVKQNRCYEIFFPRTHFFNIKTSFILLLVENLFVKRIVCISCKRDLIESSKICSQCPNDYPKRLAIVFDSIQETLFTQVYDHLHFIINSYRERFTKQEIDNETNDIVYNKNYKIFRDSIHYAFISLIIHLDGINLDKSKIYHLWILSCSIVELPPVVRGHRQNNIILSLWIAKEQPDINLWLDRCFSQLTNLKITGKSTI